MIRVRLMAWFKRFADPIILPDRRELLTLHDAAEYITALPKAEHAAADLASRDGNAALGRRARRVGNAGADRGLEGAELNRTAISWRGARSQAIGTKSQVTIRLFI